MSIYLACTDKEIEKKQKEVEAINELLLVEYRKLSLWRRFCGDGKKIKIQITRNWLSFNRWMNLRMRERKRVDYKVDWVQ